MGLSTAETTRTKVIVRRALGHNKTKIANDLGMARNTVARILNESEIAQTVQEGRSEVHQRIPASMKVVDYKLAHNDGTVAMGVLRGTGVLRGDGQVNIGVLSNGNVIVGTWPEFAGALPGTVQEATQSTQDAQTIDSAPIEPDKG